MPETGIFLNCALPFLFMCTLTVATAGPAAVRSALAADEPHSQPARYAPNQSPGIALNNDDAKPEAGTAPKVGDRMPDGTIYAGTSPDSGKAMYTTSADAKLTYSFNQAQTYAEKRAAHGHLDWRVPTRGELNVLFQNRAAIGGFSISGLHPAGWYWSSTQYSDYGAWDQRFSDGHQDGNYKGNAASVRLVR